jgi:hypothetical protein
MFMEAMMVLNFLEGRKARAQARRQGRRMEQMTQEQMEEARRFRDEQMKLLAIEKEKYREMVFVNPFEDLENPFEDLTVNTLEAEFMSRRGEQNRANILSNLRAAAGSSGISGLAQTLANQGMLQNQRIAATIGKQEQANQMAEARGAMQVDMARARGEAGVQAMEAGRQANLLSMQAAVSAQAATNLGQAQLNQMSAATTSYQMQSQAAMNQQSAMTDMFMYFDKNYKYNPDTKSFQRRS